MALPTPVYMRYSKLTIAADDSVTPDYTHDFQCSSTSIGLTSTGGDVTSVSTLCPDGSFSETAPRQWQLSVVGLQDVESTDSFMLFLMDHEGESAFATFYPKTDGTGAPVGRGWEGTVSISVPDTVGGVEPGNYATFNVVLPYVGKPVAIDAAGAPIVAGASSRASRLAEQDANAEDANAEEDANSRELVSA